MEQSWITVLSDGRLRTQVLSPDARMDGDVRSPPGFARDPIGILTNGKRDQLHLQEPVLGIPEVLAIVGDNPMQSEFACHIGLRGRLSILSLGQRD